MARTFSGRGTDKGHGKHLLTPTCAGSGGAIPGGGALRRVGRRCGTDRPVDAGPRGVHGPVRTVLGGPLQVLPEPGRRGRGGHRGGAFRVAFDRRRRYDQKYRDARPWLFGIATNLLRDHFRAGAREEDKLGRSAALEGEPRAEISSLERQFLGSDLTAALAGIPAADRDALLLLAWAELSYEQIAEALGTPIGTVRSRISRARHRVREHLEANGEHRRGNEAAG